MHLPRVNILPHIHQKHLELLSRHSKPPTKDRHTHPCSPVEISSLHQAPSRLIFSPFAQAPIKQYIGWADASTVAYHRQSNGSLVFWSCYSLDETWIYRYSMLSWSFVLSQT